MIVTVQKFYNSLYALVGQIKDLIQRYGLHKDLCQTLFVLWFYFLFVGPTIIFARRANDNILFPTVPIPLLKFTFSVTFYYVFCICNLYSFRPYSQQFLLLSFKFRAIFLAHFFILITWPNFYLLFPSSDILLHIINFLFAMYSLIITS